MTKVQLEIIKEQILPHIIGVYKDTAVYVNISFQETNTVTFNAPSSVDKLSKSNVASFCITMITPSGAILKLNRPEIPVGEMIDLIDGMLTVCQTAKPSDSGRKLYRYISTGCATQDTSYCKQTDIMDEDMVTTRLRTLAYKMRERTKLFDWQFSIYCLQFFEWNLFLDSSGSFIYQEDRHFSIRMNVKGDVDVQLSLYGDKLDSETMNGLLDNLYLKYQYRLDILQYGKLVEPQPLSSFPFIVCDFDFFGGLLHEGVGHALETDAKESDRPYRIGEELPCKNVCIIDSGKISTWANVKYDSWGHLRPEIYLIEKGTVKSYLNGLYSSITRDTLQTLNHCDRRSKPECNPQTRMSALNMIIDDAHCQEIYFQSLFDVQRALNNDLRVLFLLGCQRGRYNIRDKTVTIFPEVACCIKKNSIQYWNAGEITTQAQDVVPSIVYGYGRKSEHYNFCEKGKQTVATSSFVNQFVLTKNFIKDSK